MKSAAIAIFLAASLNLVTCADSPDLWKQYGWNLDQCQQKYTQLVLNNCRFSDPNCFCPNYSSECQYGTTTTQFSGKRSVYHMKRKGNTGPVCKNMGSVLAGQGACYYVNTNPPPEVRGPGKLPPLSAGFVDGWGAVHIDQAEQKGGKARLTVIMFDAAKPSPNVVGCTLDAVTATVNQAIDLYSRLPAVLLITVLHNDDLSFAYNGLSFFSNSTYTSADGKTHKFCSVGGWNKGSRQINCGYTIASGRGAWQPDGSLAP